MSEENKVPTGIWYRDLKTHKDYYDLVKTGLAWECYCDLPLTWEEAEKIIEENNI